MTDFDALVSNYADGADTSPPADGVPSYDALVGRFAAARAAQAQAVNAAAQMGDADKASRAEAVGKSLGLPAAVVSTDLPAFEQRAAIARSSATVAQSPALQDWMLSHPEKAVLAAGDFDNLSWIGQKIASFNAGYDQGEASGRRGELYLQVRNGGGTAGERAAYAALKAETPPEVTGGLNSALEMLGSVSGTLAEAFNPGGWRPGSVQAGMRTMSGAELPNLGAMVHGFETGVGMSLEHLDPLLDAAGNHISEGAKWGAAIVGGLVNAAMMRVGGGMAQGAVAKALPQVLAEAVARPGEAEAWRAFGQGMMRSAGHAGGVAAGATALNLMAEQAARGATNALDGADFDTWASNPEQIPQALGQVVHEALTWGLFGAAMHAMPSAPGLVADVTRARRATADVAFVNDLAQGAQDSALRRRSPDAFHAFVAGQTDGSPVENLYVPAAAVRELYQSFGAEPGAGDPLFGFVPDMAKQLATAEQVGGDVRIPTAAYAAHLAGTDVDARLRPDIRPGEGGYSLREAQQANTEVQEALRRAWDDMQKNVARDTEAQNPAEAVANDVRTRLRAIDIAPDEAEAQARLYGAHYATVAELHNRHGGDTDAWAEYQKAQVRWQRHLPEPLRRIDPDALIAVRRGEGPDGPDLFTAPGNAMDALLDDLRAGRMAAQRSGATLAQFVSRRGGVTDPGGELKGMGAERWHVGKAFARKLLRPDQGPDGKYHPDAVAQAAAEAGYFPELQGERPTPDQLIEALRDEMRGNPRHADLSGRLDDTTYAEARTEMERALDDMGIDLGQGLGRNNGYVKERLARWAAQDRPDGGRELAQAADEVRQVMAAADEPGHAQRKARMGDVSDWLRDEAARAGVSIDGYSHAIDTSAIRHIRNRHGDAARETARGNLPVTDADIAALPSLLAAPDKVAFGPKSPRGQAQIVYVKKAADGSTLVVEEVRTGRRELAVTSMRRYPATIDVLGNVDLYVRNDGGDKVSIVDVPAGVSPLKGRDLGQSKRGSIHLPPAGYGNGPHLVTLFKARDRSTLFHETAHLWLEELQHHAADPEAPPLFRRDLDAIRAWLGVADGAAIDDAAHEQFARGFEAYLMEGKAPTADLAGVFARIRAWLVGVYRKLSGREPGSLLERAMRGLSREAGMPIELSDDVRGVMDRLLATEDEIAEARRQAGMEPKLFASADLAAMTPEEYRGYADAWQKARDEAVGALEQKTMAVYRREAERAWKEGLAAERGKAQAEVDARGDIQALHYFRTGRMLDGTDTSGRPRLRLNRRALVDRYGPGIVKDLPGAVPEITHKDGMDPDLAGELLGFKDGDELVKALLQLRQQEDQLRAGGDTRSLRTYLAETLAHQRMVEMHGDPLTDGSAADAALQAVHTDRQAEVLAAEIRALGRAKGTGGIPGLRQGARAWAERVVGEAQVKGYRANGADTRAERKAARDAEKALLAGDRIGAMRAKHRQLLAHELVRAVQRADEDVEAARGVMARWAAKASSKSVDQPYLDRIHEVLGRFGVDTVRDPAELGRALGGQSLDAFVAEKEADLRTIAVPDWLFTTPGKAVGDLTVDQVRDLRDAIDSLAANGRAEQKIVLGGRALELKALQMEAEDQVSGWKLRQPHREWDPADIPGLRGAATRLGALARAGDAGLLKMEQVFNWLDNDDPNGVFNRVFRTLKDAQHRENDLLADVAGRVRALAKTMPKGWRKDLDRLIEVPELIDKRTGKPMVATKKKLVAAALNVGNDSNLAKLLGGHGWSETALRTVLDRELTKADWDYVQGIWDTFAHLQPEIDDLQRRTTGIGIKTVEPVAVSTKFGTYRGGYYPVVYDAARDYGAEKARQQSPSTLAENNYQRAVPARGHTRTRTEVDTIPVALNLDLSGYKLGQAVHDLAFREAVVAADKFLNSKAIRDLVDRTLGVEYSRQFRPWLQSIANSRNIDDRGLNALDRFVSRARLNSMIVGIGFRLSTMLKHGTTAALNSVGELGPRWLAVGAREFFGTPEHMAQVRDFVYGKSGEMRNRMDSIDRDVRESLDRLSGEAHGWEAFRRGAAHFGHYGVAMLDMASAMPTWLGAYRKALAEGRAEADAVWMADKAVRNAHGAQGITDLAAIQRGSETQKLLTMFYGFFNHIYNRQRDTLRIAGRMVGRVRDGDLVAAREDFAMVLARSFFYVLAPAVIEAAVAEGLPSDDKEEGWGEWTAKAVLGEIPAGLPLVRDMAKAAISGRKYEMSPVGHGVDALITAFGDVMDAMTPDAEVSPKWVRHLAEAPGYLFGLPTGQPSVTLQYLWDVADGDEDPEGGLDFLRGVFFGVKKHH